MATGTATAEAIETERPRRRRSGRWRITGGLLSAPLVWLIVILELRRLRQWRRRLLRWRRYSRLMRVNVFVVTCQLFSDFFTQFSAIIKIN
jgi:hypothetical protein